LTPGWNFKQLGRLLLELKIV